VSAKEISAAAVMKLRQTSGLPMMKCKEALEACDGDMEKAVEWLRKKGLDMAAKKADRAMKEGRVAIKTSPDAKSAVMVEIDCETEPVAGGPDFKALVEGVLSTVYAKKAKGGAGELPLTEVLALPHGGATVEVAVQNLVAKIGENMGLRRAAAVETAGRVGTYLHFNGKLGVLTELAGPATALASAEATSFLSDLGKHVAFAKPAAVSRTEVSPAMVEKELEIYREQAKQDPKMAGKPAPMVEKILLGKLDKFYAERCLLEQPWVMDDKQSVKQVLAATSKQAGGELSIKRSVLFQVGA
jgi:elongation factor Ts